MRCLVCGGWVGTSPYCACGFDAVTKDVAPVLALARRDRRLAIFHLTVGALTSGCLIAIAVGAGLEIFMQLMTVLCVVIGIAIFGLAGGALKYRHANRRLTVATEMRALPAARVVRRDR